MRTWVLNTPLLFEDSSNGLFFKGFFITQSAVTCSKLAKETLKRGVKYVQG